MDIEKNRTEYVNRLEQQLKHLQAEHDRYKSIADKWEPKFTTKQGTENNNVSFGLELGGKFVHVNVTPEYLQDVDLTSGVSTITDALIKNLVVDQLRALLTPEFDRAQRGAKAIVGAGKW